MRNEQKEEVLRADAREDAVAGVSPDHRTVLAPARATDAGGQRVLPTGEAEEEPSAVRGRRRVQVPAALL